MSGAKRDLNLAVMKRGHVRRQLSELTDTLASCADDRRPHTAAMLKRNLTAFFKCVGFDRSSQIRLLRLVDALSVKRSDDETFAKFLKEELIDYFGRLAIAEKPEVIALQRAVKKKKRRKKSASHRVKSVYAVSAGLPSLGKRH